MTTPERPTPPLGLVGLLSAVLVFFGCGTGFLFSWFLVLAVLNPPQWVQATGTLVDTTPYTDKKGIVTYRPVYEYELDGGRFRCHADRLWRDGVDQRGDTVELFADPNPPHRVIFHPPSEEWASQFRRIGCSLALIAVGGLIGTVVKRREPEFEYHPTFMAGVTLFMLAVVMGVGTLLSGGAEARKTGVPTTATVTAIEQLAYDRRGNLEQVPVFEYHINENVVQGRPDRGYSSPPCRVGETMEIRYDRQKVVRVAWSRCDDGGNLFDPPCVMPILAGVLSALFFRVARRLDPKPMPESTPAASSAHPV